MSDTMFTHDPEQPFALFGHFAKHLQVSPSRRIDAESLSFLSSARSFEAATQPETHRQHKDGTPINPGIYLKFAPEVLDAVQVETLHFLHTLARQFPVLNGKQFEFLILPVLLSPAVFDGTGGMPKDQDYGIARRKAGWQDGGHGSADVVRVIQPVYLPHEVSVRTPARRMHLAMRTARLCGYAGNRVALSTPDDYLVWQVLHMLLMFMPLPTIIMPLPTIIMSTARAKAAGSLSTFQFLTETPSDQPSMSASGLVGMAFFDPVAKLTGYADADHVSAMSGTIGSNGAYLRHAQRDGGDYTRDRLFERVQAQLVDTSAVKKVTDEAARHFNKGDVVEDIVARLTTQLHRLNRRRADPKAAVFVQNMVDILLDVATIPQRVMAAARSAYDADGTIAGLSVLWAEDRISKRFSKE